MIPLNLFINEIVLSFTPFAYCCFDLLCLNHCHTSIVDQLICFLLYNCDTSLLYFGYHWISYNIHVSILLVKAKTTVPQLGVNMSLKKCKKNCGNKLFCCHEPAARAFHTFMVVYDLGVVLYTFY